MEDARMAGRPLTMARRVRKLADRQFDISEELNSIAAKTHASRTDDQLGQCWQTAVGATYDASHLLTGLACFMDLKAKEAQKRTAAASMSPQTGMGSDDPDDPPPDEADATFPADPRIPASR
jgi:hypothetical protein